MGLYEALKDRNEIHRLLEIYGDSKKNMFAPASLDKSPYHHIQQFILDTNHEDSPLIAKISTGVTLEIYAPLQFLVLRLYEKFRVGGLGDLEDYTPTTISYNKEEQYYYIEFVRKV